MNNCSSGTVGQGYCKKHYSRHWKWGDANYSERIRDGRTKHELFRMYTSMQNRCYDTKNTGFKYYGGKGVVVCDRWMDYEKGFWNFVEDMGERPSPTHRLDRIDNMGIYEPSNCRWASRAEQASNKSNNNKVVGVYWNKGCGRWFGKINRNGKKLFDKGFDSYEDAVKYVQDYKLNTLNEKLEEKLAPPN